MATPRVLMLRSITSGNRPSGRLYGEPYVNFGDNQFGVFDSGNAAHDLLGVPNFSASKSYAVGNPVNFGGQLYIAAVAVSVGAFNSAQWTPITSATINAPQLNIVNGKLIESHTSNAATFAIKTSSGADPSTGNPVGIVFPDGSIISIVAALSLVIPSGSTLGIASGTPFRLWFALFNNGGVPVLAVRYCNGGGFAPSGFDIRGITTASIIGGSTVAATNYGNVAVSTPSYYRVVGFADYESGLATAGSWAVSPTRIILGANLPQPGATIQTKYGSFSQSTTTSNTFINSNITLGFNQFSPINPLRVQISTDVFISNPTGGGGEYISVQLLRTPGNIVSGASVKCYCSSNGGVSDQYSVDVLDLAPLSPVYAVQFRLYIIPATAYLPNNFGHMFISELMG